MPNERKTSRSYSPPTENAPRHPFPSAPGAVGTSTAPAKRTENYEDFLNRIKGDLTYGGVKMTEADWRDEEDRREYLTDAGEFRGMDPGDDDVFHEEGSNYYDFEDIRYAQECEIPVNQVSDHWAHVAEEMKGEMLQLQHYRIKSQSEMKRLEPIIEQARDTSTEADRQVKRCEYEMQKRFTKNGLDVPIEYTTDWNRLRKESVKEKKRYKALLKLVEELEDYQYLAAGKFEALQKAYRHREGWFYLDWEYDEEYVEDLGGYCEELLETSARVKSTVPNATNINNNNV